MTVQEYLKSKSIKGDDISFDQWFNNTIRDKRMIINTQFADEYIANNGKIVCLTQILPSKLLFAKILKDGDYHLISIDVLIELLSTDKIRLY